MRELRNVMERAVLLADEAITTAELALGRPREAPPAIESEPPARRGGSAAPVEVDLSVPLKDAKRAAGEAVERAYLLAALRRTGWNKRQAARLVELNYKTLREKVKEHDLDRLRYDDPGAERGE